jgi:hypothetical protein
MPGDSPSIRFGELTDALGVRSLDRGDLRAAHHRGRRKSRPALIRNDDIIIPPTILGARNHQNP